MAAVMREVTKSIRGASLDPELKPVDQLAQMWAEQTADSSPMSSNPIARCIAEAEGAALQGGSVTVSEEVMLFDRALARSSVRTQRFFSVWYRQSGTSDTRAARLGISRAGLYTEWKMNLAYIKGVLHGYGLTF